MLDKINKRLNVIWNSINNELDKHNKRPTYLVMNSKTYYEIKAEICSNESSSLRFGIYEDKLFGVDVLPDIRLDENDFKLLYDLNDHNYKFTI